MCRQFNEDGFEQFLNDPGCCALAQFKKEPQETFYWRWDDLRKAYFRWCDDSAQYPVNMSTDKSLDVLKKLGITIECDTTKYDILTDTEYHGKWAVGIRSVYAGMVVRTTD
jgi:hypothetical protein